MAHKKKSFFQKLSGIVNMSDEPEDFDFDNNEDNLEHVFPQAVEDTEEETAENWMEKEAEEGQLTVDVYQNSSDIIIKAMVAGVRGEELDITITREMVTIKGTRHAERTVNDNDYFHKELYWGAFTRTILLPAEVEPEEAEATEKHGLLTIKLPKIDRGRQMKVRVKSGV